MRTKFRATPLVMAAVRADAIGPVSDSLFFEDEAFEMLLSTDRVDKVPAGSVCDYRSTDIYQNGILGCCR